MKSLLRGVPIAVGVVAVAPLTWWLAEGLPDEVPPSERDRADYVWDPPVLTDSQRGLIGAVSAALVLVAGLVTASSIRAQKLPREWAWVAAATAGVAGYGGLTYATATSPVVGANIGFGLLALGGVVVVPALVGVSIWMSRRACAPFDATENGRT